MTTGISYFIVKVFVSAARRSHLFHDTHLKAEYQTDVKIRLSIGAEKVFKKIILHHEAQASNCMNKKKNLYF